MKKDWEKLGLCRGKDNEIFFPDDATPMTSKKVKSAKAMCKACQVSAECLFFAISNDERFGIWGGFSPRERRAITRHYRKQFNFETAFTLVNANDNTL